MLNFSNDDRKQLREAILSAYPDPDDLKLFVDEKLSQNLAAIAGTGKYNNVVFELIQWAIAKGYSDDLILALAKDTRNPDIQQFCGRVLQGYFNLNDVDGNRGGFYLPLDSQAWGLEISDESLQLFFAKPFDLVADVGQLQRGLERANSVCKITFVDRGPEECGTGVLIAPNLVLTNYHVLSLDDHADLDAIARMARFQFNYVSKPFGETVRTEVLQTVAANPVVRSSPIKDLDYALLKLSVEGVESMVPVPLETTARLVPKSALNILQHPEGEQMKVSLSNNGVVKTDESRGLVLYVNAAKGGSSGSPCFNNEWKLVALHHKEIATSFGSLREGILISTIYRQIYTYL